MMFGWERRLLQLLFIECLPKTLLVNATVKNRIDVGWETDTLRRSPRGGVEQEQWDGILSLIQDLQFVVNS